MSTSDSKNSVQEKLNYFELQVSNRDKEITRLQAKIDINGINLEKVAYDYSIKTSEEKIERLSNQIDYLSKENENLENEFKNYKYESSKTEKMRFENQNYSNVIKELKAKNEELKDKLANSEKSVEGYRKEKLNEERELIERKNRELEELNDEIQALKNKIEILTLENRTFKDNSAKAGTL